MTDVDVDGICSLLSANIGDGLRGVVEYRDGEIVVHHMRDSLDADERESRSKHGLLKRITGTSFPPDDPTFGAHRLSIHCFDSVTAIHVQIGERTGIVASLETDVVSDVNIDQLMRMLGQTATS